MSDRPESDAKTGGKAGGRSRGRPKRRRPPPVATAAYLRSWALRYLDRYSASAGHLRRLMLLKLSRSARIHGAEQTADKGAVEALIAELAAQGLLDDEAYAASRARALPRRGVAAQGIRARLAERGVAQPAIERALAALRDEAGDPELAAALRYARRRGLGPFRSEEMRAERRERDLAALDRRGFAYEVARRVIDAEDLEALQDEANAAAT
ncbi:MAG: RecX family transcriptional regulator [Kiloniellales bacterium]